MMKTLISVKKSLSLFGKTYGYLRRSTFPDSNHAELKRLWGEESLRHVGVTIEVIGQVCLDPSVLFVGNHISYLDIPLLMSQVHDISFVAKEEVAAWPLFGHGAKAAKTIFVKREDKADRTKSRQAITEGLKQGHRIAIFPSGTTCLDEKKDWKKGAFEIAKENHCLVQPFRITYSPLRAAAYIDDDFFPFHLAGLFHLGPIRARIEFHPPVHVDSPIESCQRWQNWTREKIFRENQSADS